MEVMFAFVCRTAAAEAPAKEPKLQQDLQVGLTDWNECSVCWLQHFGVCIGRWVSFGSVAHCERAPLQ